MRISSLPSHFYKPDMPNLCQTDERSETLRNDGLSLCGPVAASNILIDLAKNHFPSIVENLWRMGEVEAQLKLVDELTKHMQTNEDGTSTTNLIEGIRKYLDERGYGFNTTVVEVYEGQKDFTPDIISDPTKIMPHVVGMSNVILSVTFCRFDPASKIYEYVEGHFITLAGFLNSDISRLVVHDPDPATEREPAICRLTRINEGKLLGWNDENEYEECDAGGFNELEGIGIHQDDRREGANKIVLDGVVAFEVFRK